MSSDFKPFEEVETYGDLLSFLRSWRSFEDPQVYDFGGMVHLLKACLDNLNELAVEGEIEDIGNYLDEKQKRFLTKLAEAAQLRCDEC